MRIILCLFTIQFLLSAGMASADEMRFCIENKQQPPLIIGNSDQLDSEAQGITVEITRQAARQVGLTPSFIRAPWKRCLLLLREGKVDAVFNGSFKWERLVYGVYPMRNGNADPDRRITEISYSLYRRRGDAVTWDGQNFSGLDGKVSAPLGYSIVGELRKQGLEVEESNSTELILQKLSLGRVSAVAAQTITADAVLTSGRFPEIEKVSPPLVNKPYYVLISHHFMQDRRETALEFWRVVAGLRDQETGRLLRKYTH